MEPDRTCKRCSVARVNSLCKAYGLAHAPGGERVIPHLRELASLVKSRGLDNAGVLLTPGLSEKDLRSHCWNISSFLSDEEASRILGSPV